MKNYKKIFLVLLIMAVFVITGCTSKEKEPNSGGTNPNPDSGNNTGSGNNKTEKLEDKISSSGAIAENGHFVVFAKNDNSVPVQMKVEVEFYDENDMILGSDDETFTAVGANSEIAVEMWSTPESFDHYKIYVDVDKTNVTTYFDKIEVIHNNNGENVVVQIKNNSEDEIEFIGASVVYYQGDKVVGIADDLETDVKPGRAANFTLHFPRNKEYRKIDFDSYKVFVTHAYTFGW